MGDSIEQWRATIGQWSGGRAGQCVTLQHRIDQTSNHIGYRQIRFLVLVSLLVIGCVELNPGPGPDHETPAPSQNVGALPKFSRRPGSVGLHGELYGVKTAAFLFARALNKTEEFHLASNVDGAGTFDDLVFRYRLRKPDVWKTCFIQLKHKKNRGKIQRSSLLNMSGDFSLFKYFESYCQIKASAERNLKQCGPFVDFEFVIYTNARMESNSLLQGGDSDPISILSSGTNDGKYITFDEHRDTDIFKYFEELSRYAEGILQLEHLIKREKLMGKQIEEKIKDFRLTFIRQEILDRLDGLQSNPSKMENLVKELQKCDFSLYEEFLGKLKIFQSQSDQKSFEQLINGELQVACQASLSCADSIYRKFDEALRQWWEESGSVKWLNENSHVWQSVKQYVTEEIQQLSEYKIEKTMRCDLIFNQHHIKRLSDAIQQNTVLIIIPNTKFSILSKLKTYQALVSLNYENSVFINSISLLSRSKDVFKLWPCKWSATLVIDCVKQSDSVDENVIDTLVSFLHQYQQKLILISPAQQENLASRLREKLGNICTDYEDTCDISDLDAKSQKEIFERTVNFQGTNVALQTLAGTDPPECIKHLIDSDVISILLSNEHKLCVGRQLSDLSKYYVPRVLQHHIYLKEEILKLTDKKITFAVSGLQADKLKKYLPAGEKICEFVYDEREGSRSFKIVSDFSKTGLSAESGTMKAHQKLGLEIKPDDDRYNMLGNINAETDDSGGKENNYFNIVANFSKYGLSADLENMKTYNEAGQNINPEDVRYIILGKENPESEFGELKALITNAHWIHVEKGSFLWRDTNCSIDIIRRYNDDTKCKKYDMKRVIEHSDRTMLLVAEPGMGKSTFLSHMEHEIKKQSPSVWILRINLNEHTRALENIEFGEECIDKCKEFLWNAERSPEQGALTMIKKIFLQALDETGKVFIILDGFDEISPYYTPKVSNLIKAIRDKTASKILVSSRFSYRRNLEDLLIKLAFTLQPFKQKNQIQFLEQYWNKDIKRSKQGNLRTFAKKLLNLCSQNFSDKDGEFTGIPLQTMMLGETFLKEAVEYCSKGELNLPEKFNLLYLFKKFWEKKCDIYFSEKNAMDSSKQEVISEKESYLQKHMIAALMSLFSLSEENRLFWATSVSDLEQANMFLQNGRAEKLGIIRDIKDGTPNFIHRCFAEYFAAKWFTDNYKKCENFISDFLFNSTYEVTRNIFDRMLAGDSEIHGAVLNNDISAVEKLLKNKTDINFSDKGGRTALHLAASYNSPLIQKLLSGPGVTVNKPDGILKWTPLKYADRTKSWMAMDILLQNGANPDDIVLTRNKCEAQEWGQRALWECASKGHRNLLEFLLNCGYDVNAVVNVPDNQHVKCTLFHRASFCGQTQVVRILVDRKSDINIRTAKNHTAVHLAAESGSVGIIKLLLDEGMSVNVTNTNVNSPLHISALRGKQEATKTLVERGAALNRTNKYGNTPLMLAAFKRESEIFHYLTESGADINIRNNYDDSALHFAALSNSVDIIKLLLDKGMSVNLTNANGQTPLYVAAQYGKLEATKTLVESGAALNDTTKYGNAPLMEAAFKGESEIFLYLTEKGADINIRNNYDDSALHFAALSNSVDIIKLLLDKEMSVNLTNKYGLTPLHVAAQYGKLEATKTLVERRAALNVTNKYGDTPLMLAALEGKTEVFHYLRENGANISIRNNDDDIALHSAALSDSVEFQALTG